jgi:membrane protease YdiL (CAAX protease family)
MQGDAERARRWRWAVAFFAVTYLVTALLWLPVLRSGESVAAALSGRLLPLLLLASVTPSVVAFVLAGIEGGGAAARDLLGQVGRWRFGIGWYAVAMLLEPLIWVMSLALAILLGGRGPEVQLDFLIPIAAIGEEFGWRGYALPRLQGRIGALPASLLIGVVWAAWHLPYFADPSIHPLPFWIDFGLFVVVLVSQSVLATWIYNSTRGSVLATILHHHSIHMASLVPVIPGILGTAVMAIVSVVAAGAAVIVSGGSLVGLRRSTASGVVAKPGVA